MKTCVWRIFPQAEETFLQNRKYYTNVVYRLALSYVHL